MSDIPALPARSVFRRVGAMITQPRRGFSALLDNDDAHPIEPLAAYALVVLAIHAAETFRLLSLATNAPLVVARRLFDVVVRAGATDLAVVAGCAAVVSIVAKTRGVPMVRAAIATTYLLVPLTLLKAVGGACAVAGLELWWLPHRAVDSMAVVVNGHLDVGRMVLKSVVAYAPGALVLLDWLFRRGARLSPSLAAPRVGTAVLAMTTTMLVLGAAVDVANRADVLKPALQGDAFPSMRLPMLEGSGSVDVVELVGEGKAKVLIVDFWASWCGPCRRSMPELSALAQAYKDKGVAVMGINREPRDRDAARAAWRELAPSFDSVVDTKGLGERVGLTSLPSSYIVDRSGRIRHLHLGLTSIESVRAEVDALLAEQH
jgi:thiol-disulfide isomerase/thioredoxin